jgi:hypothetical protein
MNADLAVWVLQLSPQGKGRLSLKSVSPEVYLARDRMLRTFRTLLMWVREQSSQSRRVTRPLVPKKVGNFE